MSWLTEPLGAECGVDELVGADGVLRLLGFPQRGPVDLRGDPSMKCHCSTERFTAPTASSV